MCRKLILWILVVLLMLVFSSCIGKTILGNSMPVPDRPGTWLSADGNTFVEVTSVNTVSFAANPGLEPPGCRIGDFDNAVMSLSTGDKLVMIIRLAPDEMPDKERYWATALNQKMYILEEYERYNNPDWLRPVAGSGIRVTNDRSPSSCDYIWLEWDISSMNLPRGTKIAYASEAILDMYQWGGTNTIPLILD